MSVFLTNDELKLFADNGISENDIQNTINAYRKEGVNDNEIRSKIDTKIASFNGPTKKTGIQVPREEEELFALNGYSFDDIRGAVNTLRGQGFDDDTIRGMLDKQLDAYKQGKTVSGPVRGPRKEGTLETTERLLESTARGVPIAGAFYDKYAATMDALNQWGSNAIEDLFFGNKTYKDTQGDTSIGALYQHNLRKQLAKKERDEQGHPVQTLVAELAGGAMMPVGAAGTASKGATLVNKIGEAAKVAVPTMAVDAGLRTDGDLVDRLEASVKGGAAGAMTAPVAGVTSHVLGKTADGLSKHGDDLVSKIAKIGQSGKKTVVAPIDELPKSNAYQLKKALGNKERANQVLQEAQDKGMTLAEMGNDNVNRVLQAAEMASPDARTTISNFREKFEGELPQRVEQELDKVLHTQSGMKSIPEMQEFYNAQAKPLYDQANATKIPVDLLRPDNADGFYGNALIADAADKATKNYARTFGGRGDVKVDDLQFWDGVKRVIDDEINIAEKAGEKNVARNLKAAKNELVSKLDELSPVYKQARSVASNTPAVEKAEGVAEKIFNSNMTPESLSKQIGEMTPAELDAVKIGIRNKITSMMESKIDPSTGFSKLLTPQAQKNLKLLLGDDAANELIDFAKRTHSTKTALYAAKGGSQTGVRVTMADELNQGAKDAASVKGVGSAINYGVRKVTDSLVRDKNNKTFNELAELILLGKNSNMPANPNTPKTNKLLRTLNGIATGSKSGVSNMLQNASYVTPKAISQPAMEDLIKALQ